MSSAVTDTTVKDAFDALRAAAARHGAPHANLRALMQGTAGRGRGGGLCTLRGVLSAVSRTHPLLTHPVHAVVAGGRELRVQCLSGAAFQGASANAGTCSPNFGKAVPSLGLHDSIRSK